MLKTEPLLERAFGKRHQKPAFENKVGDDRHTKRHAQDGRPAILAEPSHEPADEDDRRDIQAGEWHRTDIDRSRNDDAHNLTKLSPFGKKSVVLVPQCAQEIYRAGAHYEHSNIQWK